MQDLVQLKRDYPDEWETFIGNSSCVTFFNVMDQFSCDYFSKMLGIKTIERISVSTAEERKKDPTYKAMADQWFARDLMQPAEVRKLRYDMGALISTNQPSLFIKITYYEDNDLLIRARCDPHFPKMRELQAAAFEAEKKKVANQTREDAKKRIPNFKAAQEATIKAGYKVEKSGMISKKITVTFPDDTQETISGEGDFIEWARRNV